MHHRTIECVWEELLLINDDIKHLQTGNEILFFEIVSMMNMPKKDFVGVGKYRKGNCRNNCVKVYY